LLEFGVKFDRAKFSILAVRVSVRQIYKFNPKNPLSQARWTKNDADEL